MKHKIILIMVVLLAGSRGITGEIRVLLKGKAPVSDLHPGLIKAGNTG